MTQHSSRVLRSDDPTCQDLAATGWVIGSTSWGARLHVRGADIVRLQAVVDNARASGICVLELSRRDANDIVTLEELTHPDYPQTPATFREKLDLSDALGLFDGGRAFGIWLDSKLVAVTVTRVCGDLVETDFTSVHPAQRQRGLATTIKAASVLANAAEGHRSFGTGGAGVNDASLHMNRAVGYQITETWHTYLPPPLGD